MVKSDSEMTANHKQNNAEIHKIKPIERGFIGRLFSGLGKFCVRTLTRLEVRGTENLPAEAPYIIAPNHETYVDGMLATMGLPKKHYKKLTCLAAKELEESSGLFGKIIMRVGRGIPIDRKGSALQSLRISIHQLEEGNILLIHPEGTRSADGRLGTIHDGCSFIAKHSGCLVIPVFIDGGYEIFSRHMKFPKPFKSFGKRRRLIITYGEALDPADYKNTKAMTADISAWLHDMYDRKEIPREYVGKNLIYKQKAEAKAKRRAEARAKAAKEDAAKEDSPSAETDSKSS